jgi:hypothetical protein
MSLSGRRVRSFDKLRVPLTPVLEPVKGTFGRLRTGNPALSGIPYTNAAIFSPFISSSLRYSFGSRFKKIFRQGIAWNMLYPAVIYLIIHDSPQGRS